MSVTIWCFLAKDEHIFPVDIDEMKTVGHLKKKIKEEKPGELKDVDADRLGLYKLPIDNTFEESEEFLNRLSQNLNINARLRSKSQILEAFPPGQEYLTLVQKPPGQSIDPRRCPHSCLNTPCSSPHQCTL